MIKQMENIELLSLFQHLVTREDAPRNIKEIAKVETEIINRMYGLPSEQEVQRIRDLYNQ